MTQVKRQHNGWKKAKAMVEQGSAHHSNRESQDLATVAKDQHD